MSRRKRKKQNAVEEPVASAPIESESTTTGDEERSKFVFQLLGLGWLIVFSLFFFSFTLPNNQPITRFDVWQLLPELLLDNIVPIREEGAPPSGWQFFPQRLKLIAIAVWVIAGAWSIGYLVLAGIGLAWSKEDNTEDAGPSISSLESGVLSAGVGLSLWSLITLGLGLLGLLNRPVFAVVLTVPIFATLYSLRHAIHKRFLRSENTTDERQFEALPLVCLAAVVPFLVAMTLGSMLPSVDFDVKEYHIQGPKEFYQNGHISMLPHNVYTSFPFLTEMLTLSAMVLHGDWYWGAMAGKAILMGFAPLTALAVFLIARRLMNDTAGWLALLVHLTTPWTYRISIIAYTEGGLSFYVAATLLATVIAFQNRNHESRYLRLILVTGLLAGSAVACKYPGLISVTFPIGVAVVAMTMIDGMAFRFSVQRTLRTIIAFGIGVLITFGPWMAKNAFETGNPVYPLVYSIFGGADWDDELNEKWKRAHSPDHHKLSDLGVKLIDVAAKSDWQSPLLFGLAPLSFLLIRKQRGITALWLYLAWLFLSWWVLTHRIDRFWVPLIPVAAVLAGIGLSALRMPTRWYIAPVIAAAILFNLGFVTSPLCGYNAYLIDLHAARRITGNMTAPEIMELNTIMDGKEGTVLSVGEAEVFDATFPVIYNTVFDYSIFEQICGIRDDSRSPAEWEMKDVSKIEWILWDDGVQYILVNWQEILRYRHTYGYTKFVAPHRFTWLVEQQTLKPPLPNKRFFRKFDSLNEREQKDVREWAPELIQTIQGEEWLITAQIFPIDYDPLKPDTAE